MLRRVGSPRPTEWRTWRRAGPGARWEFQAKNDSLPTVIGRLPFFRLLGAFARRMGTLVFFRQDLFCSNHCAKAAAMGLFFGSSLFCCSMNFATSRFPAPAEALRSLKAESFSR